jgi:hypothetical protein
MLDETLRMMRGQQDVEKIAVNSWIDLLSGELSQAYFLKLLSLSALCRL